MPSKAVKLFEALLSGNSKAMDEVRELSDKRDRSIRKQSLDSLIITNTPLSWENAPAIQLYDYMNSAFGDDWWEWEIDTIFAMVSAKCKCTPTPQTRDKILAIRHLCGSSAAFFDWYEFNQLALSFCGAIANFEHLRFPSPGAVVAAMMIINYIRPDVEEGFSDEVKKFVSIILINNGIYTPPPSIVQYVGRVMLKEFVSKDMAGKWADIYKLYEREDFEEEDEAHIQALRIYKVEKAAHSYYYKDITKG